MRTDTTLDPWAPYYDLLHQGIPGDVDFYFAQAQAARGDILEIGVGTGRIALPIALAGLDVVGIDNSASLLTLCRYKMKMLKLAPRRLRLMKGDMRKLNLGRQFSLIYMPYRTIMHALTPDDQRRALTCARNHLADDGRFILDTWAARPSVIAKLLRKRKPSQIRYELPEENLTIVHTSSTTVDEFNQLLYEQHHIQEFDMRGQLTNEVQLPLTRSYTTAREMENLLQAEGFQVDAVCGDFGGAPLEPDSTDMIWVLRK